MVPLIVIGQRSSVNSEVGEWPIGFFAPGFLISGWWLVGRRPRLSIGWMFVVAGLTAALSGFAAAYARAALAKSWPGADWGLWVFSWLWQPQTILLGTALVLFPDAVFRSPWNRLWMWIVAGSGLLAMALTAFASGDIVTTPDHPNGAPPGLPNPVGLSGTGGFRDVSQLLQLVSGVIPILVTAVAWRREMAGVRRRQFKWVTLVQLSGVPILLVLVAAPILAGPIAIVQTFATQILIVTAILQWNAFEVDVVVRRTALAGALLVAGLGTYGTLVIGVAAVLGHGGTVPSAIGAAVAIFAFGPMSIWIRRGVNRVFYGRRDDPFVVVAEAGRRLVSASNPADGLASLMHALTDELKIPGAAVFDSHGEMLATSGVDNTAATFVDVPLLHQGESVGRLRVWHRRGSTALAASEQELLQTLGYQIGAAVQAVELVDGLKRARERLVIARQDERRRIQRDLHDGLGPQLSAVAFKLAAAGNYLSASESEKAQSLVVGAREELQRAVTDIRRLVYSLGDPTVAAFGLKAALAERLTQLTKAASVDSIVNIDELPGCSAATEEAILRIAGEAVTNVVRHAHAHRCCIDLHLVDAIVELDVIDDGIGLGAIGPHGVGTRSMAERAEELGGSCLILCGVDGGTHVSVRIPLGTPGLT
jgi:two-component system, NarL family, sensor kinase